MIAVIILFILPGVLLYPLLKPRGIGRGLSVGLGLVGIVWLFSMVGTLFRYQFALVFLLNIAGIGTLIWLNMRSGYTLRTLVQTILPRWQRWQWLLVAAISVAYLGLTYIPFVPWDTDAQGFSWLILTVQKSGTINTLAPFHPQIGWFYSPSFFVMGALLADLTGASTPDVALGLGHVLGLGLVFSLGTLGRIIKGEAGFWWSLVVAASSIALLTSLMDSAYTTMLGLWLTVTFLLCLARSITTTTAGYLSFDVLCSGLALASVLLGHGDAIIQLLIVYLPFYIVGALAKPRFTQKQYLTLTIIVPVLGVLLAGPWLLDNFNLILNIDVHERQSPVPWFGQAIWYLNGYWLLAVGILASGWAVYRRHWLGLWCALWLLATFEFGLWGNIDAISKATALDPLSVGYPYGIVWHAPIVPLPILATLLLVPLGTWLAPKVAWQRWRTGFFSLTLLATFVGLLATPLLIKTATQRLSGGPVMAIASPADLQAYAWLKHNTPTDALLLNYPGHFEGQWAPVYAEREAIYEREQLFFIGAQSLFARWDLLAPVYHDPVNPQSKVLIELTGVDYIVVPQWQGNPDSFKRDYQRLRLPDNTTQLSWFADADYLTLVAEFDGAQIYQVNNTQ